MRVRFDNRIANKAPIRRQVTAFQRRTIVIGPVDSALVIASYFGDLGWDVITAKTGKEARKAAQRTNACLAVLPVRGELETGWLSCAKLTKSGCKPRVVLIGPAWDEEAEQFALFAGAAAYLSDADGPEAILDVAQNRIAIES
jgi:DNA-binding response OmpR family regulator